MAFLCTTIYHFKKLTDMKSIIIASSIILANLFAVPTEQDKKQPKIQTYEVEVEGVCNECKERIEKAALIKGVRFTEWDKESHTLKVIYRTKQVTTDEIEKAISEAGHNTENFEATDEAYESLPGCCLYKTVEKH